MLDLSRLPEPRPFVRRAFPHRGARHRYGTPLGQRCLASRERSDELQWELYGEFTREEVERLDDLFARLLWEESNNYLSVYKRPDAELDRTPYEIRHRYEFTKLTWTMPVPADTFDTLLQRLAYVILGFRDREEYGITWPDIPVPQTPQEVR